MHAIFRCPHLYERNESPAECLLRGSDNVAYITEQQNDVEDFHRMISRLNGKEVTLFLHHRPPALTMRRGLWQIVSVMALVADISPGYLPAWPAGLGPIACCAETQ